MQIMILLLTFIKIKSFIHTFKLLDNKVVLKVNKIKKIINNTNKWKGDNLILEQYNEEFLEDFKCQYTYDATETLEKMLKKGED